MELLALAEELRTAIMDMAEGRNHEVAKTDALAIIKEISVLLEE